MVQQKKIRPVKIEVKLSTRNKNGQSCNSFLRSQLEWLLVGKSKGYKKQTQTELKTKISQTNLKDTKIVRHYKPYIQKYNQKKKILWFSKKLKDLSKLRLSFPLNAKMDNTATP